MPSPQPAGEPARDHPVSGLTVRPGSPSVLDLVRLSPDPMFPPGGEDLYRQIALLTDLQVGEEVLDVACGRGVATEFLATTYGVEAHGIDPDVNLIDEADQRIREGGLLDRIHFQTSDLDDLPYKDGIFDVVIGEIGLGLVDPAAAVRELARVTKPMGALALVQLAWTGNVDDEKREVLVQHLGARPQLLVEWKQIVRDAGIVDLHVEDWSENAAPFRPAGPFYDLAEIFTLRQKLGILRHALRRWGWHGVRGAVVREAEIHRLLTHDRVLGLSLIVGIRWAGDGPRPVPDQ